MIIEKDTPILMIDTETTNDIDYPFVYDLGYQIFTLASGVICEKSYVNKDIFLDDELMASALYFDKIPNYWKDIDAGQRILESWKSIKWNLRRDIFNHGVEIICAHNARFDNRAMNMTQRYLTCSKHRYFLPYNKVTWWDTLKMARAALKQNEDYTSFCWNNDYITKNNQIRFTAEILYRWIIQNTDFIESHTGLEDVKIERKIFEYLVNNYPEINGQLWEDKKPELTSFFW